MVVEDLVLVVWSCPDDCVDDLDCGLPYSPTCVIWVVDLVCILLVIFEIFVPALIIFSLIFHSLILTDLIVRIVLQQFSGLFEQEWDELIDWAWACRH